MDLLMEHMKNGLVLTLLLSAPIVVTTALIGIVMGILQAVTQIHEQTLTAAPKIVLSFLILIFLGGFMMTMLQNYFFEAVHLAFTEIPFMSKNVLPPRDHVSNSRKQRQKFFGNESFPQIQSPTMHKQKTRPSAMSQQPEHKGVPIIQGGQSTQPKPGVAESMYMRQRSQSGGQ